MTDSEDLSMAPVRASTRVSIAWSGGPPEEDTDTLVLTINGISLDLRVFISGPNKGEIDWASVGAMREVESTDGNVSLAWDHIIDSRGSLPEDAGSFSTLPNGDVLETGTMHNPKTGLAEPFEEVWRRHPREKGWRYAVLESVDSKAFLGCIGPRALGLAQDGTVFRAYRDGDGKRVYEFNNDGVILPRFQVSPEWEAGTVVSLGGREWTVRTVGTLA